MAQGKREIKGYAVKPKLTALALIMSRSGVSLKGTIVEIGLDGFSFRYVPIHEPLTRRIGEECFVAIFGLNGSGRILPTLPCRITGDSELRDTDHSLCYLYQRRLGTVEYGEITSAHRLDLFSFIEEYGDVLDRKF